MHHSGYYLVSLIFGTTIPTSFNILVKCFLHFIYIYILCTQNAETLSKEFISREHADFFDRCKEKVSSQDGYYLEIFKNGRFLLLQCMFVTKLVRFILYVLSSGIVNISCLGNMMYINERCA